jgi:hypothetical protein
MIPEPQIFLGRAQGEARRLSSERLVGAFDHPLTVGSKVLVDVVCRSQRLKVQGVVDSLRRHQGKYIGTILWQDTPQQQALSQILQGHAYRAPGTKPLGSGDFSSASHVENLSEAFLKRKRRGYVLLSCLGLFLVFGMAFGLWQTFFRIYADAPFAAVTVPLRSVTASESGQLTWTLPLRPSDVLKQGQVLGLIVSPKIEDMVTRLQSDLSFLQTQIDLLKEKRQDADLILSYRQESAENLIRQKEERLRATTADYDQAVRYKKNLEPLYHKSYVSRVKWDAIVADVDKTKAIKNEANAVLTQAKTEAAMAQTFSISSGGTLQGTPQDLDREIVEKMAQHANLQREHRLLEARVQNLTLVSPCDCRIISAQSDKTWVNQGATLIQLQENDADAMVVEARLPAYVANRVQVGDAARVSLGDLGPSLPARVVDIRPVVSGDRYGLSPQVMQDPALTSVYLKPVHRGFSVQQAGMHADVSIHTYKRSELYRWLPGLSWTMSAEASSDFQRP